MATKWQITIRENIALLESAKSIEDLEAASTIFIDVFNKTREEWRKSKDETLREWHFNKLKKEYTKVYNKTISNLLAHSPVSYKHVDSGEILTLTERHRTDTPDKDFCLFKHCDKEGNFIQKSSMLGGELHKDLAQGVLVPYTSNSLDFIKGE